jgi:hypothetical protein
MGFTTIVFTLTIIFNAYFIYIKEIYFCDSIIIKRFLFKDISINYKDISYFGDSYIGSSRWKIMYYGIKNFYELLPIINELLEKGIIAIDREKNQERISIERNRSEFGIVMFFLLAIIVGISYLIQKHVINYIVDGFIVWGVIHLLVYSILKEKLK